MQVDTQNPNNTAEQAAAEPEERQQTDPIPPSGPKRQKSRHRASVACASCRDRRIRCVVPPGESECSQCKRSGVECIIKNDDERRRPISRAYVCSLTDRVSLLEEMLREKGAEPPPASHPPQTRTGASQDEETSPQRKQTQPAAPPSNQDNSTPGSQQDDFLELDQVEPDNSSHREEETESSASPQVLVPPRKEGMVKRLLSTRGHLSFDQLSGRLRYFGPTTNCHVHSGYGSISEETRESLEQSRRAEKAIRFLSIETHDYLLDLYWQHYNSVLHVLHHEAFREDKENGRTQFYSAFLHVCVLAMGYRYADKSRPDIQRIALPARESTLHREAKYMLEYELERPGGIPLISALLILGDLECGVGRDNLGWLYAGMAVRLAFDIGLHLDTRSSNLPEREVEVRRMTLWACVIYDKYWALFLGRPTSMKSSDLEIYSLTNQFERLGTCKPSGPQKSLETQIYEALLDLMELAGKITENTDGNYQTNASVDRNAHLRIAALDRELNNWYTRLPEPLRWTQANIETAPFSFFLLHQQYHSALILLHRPLATYEEPSGSDSEDNGPENHFSALSRATCTKHAIRVARIFWTHRQRFDTKLIFCTGMQHAGTAATALVAALAFIKDSSDRNNNMQYLECLSAALQDMAHAYQPAERMSTVLQAVMAELREGPSDASHRPNRRMSAVIPARRSSAADEQEQASFKRRHTAKPRPIKNARSHSMGTNNLNLNLKNLHSMGPPQFQRKADSESSQADGFVMITPRSEFGTWPPLAGDSVSAVDHPLPTPSTSLVTPGLTRNSWMGADMDVNENTHDISHLANIHFPELSAMNGDNENSHLDYMAFADNEWRDWQNPLNGNGMQTTDLDGFPPQHGSFNGFPNSPRGFVGIMEG
ncbi:hypothetical protein H2201_007841 [Coniosporium apollinis]|uniref:Zn(2)-C6 fungal-type domain-containing protein n=1 Tax=Coniosporium apollinis TaxID=61459 RepID=A0ABQ9NIA2_9PEZI|nr:hypothetical protein H2201_007841 [Coniosporium apollinis]